MNNTPAPGSTPDQQQTQADAAAVSAAEQAATASSSEVLGEAELEKLLIEPGSAVAPPKQEAAPETPGEGDGEEAKQKPEQQAKPEDPQQAGADGGEKNDAPPATGAASNDKLERELAAAVQSINKLAEKIDAGQQPTAADKKEAAAAQRKITSIQQALADKKFDAFEHGQAIAESLLETDQLAQSNQQDVQALKEEVGALRQQIAAGHANQLFTDLARKYPGANVREIWDSALQDAAQTIGQNNPALANLANRFFHTRAAAASKGAATKKEGDKPKPTSAPTPNPTTPGGNRVTQQSGTPAQAPVLDDDEAYMQRAMKLVTDD